MGLEHKNSNVKKPLRNKCKTEEIHKERERILKTYANWEEYLMPAPLSIAILGELACISAGQGDFSINMKTPPGGFQYIKYPNSFHACLMQASNQGCEAFSTAHKNMDQIRILSMNVPEQVIILDQILFQETEVVNALLPAQLSSMKSTADECKDLAKSVESKFNDVIHLIRELLEACLSSKSDYEKELEATRLKLESLKLKQRTAEEAKQKAEDYYNSIKTKFEETYQDYRTAKNNIPEGWDAVGINVVEGLMSIVTIVPNMLSSLTSLLVKCCSGENGNSNSVVGSEIMCAQFKIKLTQKMWETTNGEYKQSSENCKKQNEELNKILTAMRKRETDEVNFDTAGEILIKGLDSLGQVKEQWEKMVCFFQMISILTDSCLTHRMSQCLNLTDNVPKIADRAFKDFVIDMIFKQALNAANMAHVVHMISETYTEVSSQYLMDKVSSLGRFISMDPSNPKYQTERMKLVDGYEEAQKAIEDLVIKKKQEFEATYLQNKDNLF